MHLRTQKSQKQVSGLPQTLRNIGPHFPASKGNYANGKAKFGPCVMCRQKGIRKETSVICEECKVSLCAVPCFKSFHV